MDKEARRILTEGLLRGYAGNKKETRGRGVFVVNSSDVNMQGGAYHDEWVTGERTGGGQELAKFWYEDSERRNATRLYAGGLVAKEILDSLGITGKEVTRYLKRKIQELGAKTRFGNNCEVGPDGDWQYVYRVLRNEIPAAIDSGLLTMGLETISYKDTLVFAHGFLISPVE